METLVKLKTPNIIDINNKSTQQVNKVTASTLDITIRPVNNSMEVSNINHTNPIKSSNFVNKPFMEANTIGVSLSHLKHDCIIPVFSKDNEKTIAHQEFIELALSCAAKIFPHHTIDNPEIRVSHQIKGRIPEAIYKPVKELLDHEKTIYYERMAFIIPIPSIVEVINGNELS